MHVQFFFIVHLLRVAALSRQLFLLSVCFFLLRDGIVFGQYRFSRWTTENGLPSDWTLGIQQTPDGYLWLLAHGGLVRFDGLQFKVFNRTNIPALKSTNFAAFGLVKDHQGALWAATWLGGAIRYFDNSFIAYTTQDGLADNHVTRIDEDRNGTIWIFTLTGLCTWKEGKIVRVAPMPGSPFNSYLVPPSNLGPGIDPTLFGLWRCTASGWQRFAYGQWWDLPPPPDIQRPETAKLDRLIEDSQHRLWFKLIGRDRQVFSVDRGRLDVFKGLPANSFACFKDRFERLWITDAKGHTGLWKGGEFTPFKASQLPRCSPCMRIGMATIGWGH